MTKIIKGDNLPLGGEPMRVAVVRRSGGSGAPVVDAAALLVDGNGKVRDQGDLVFYNQPEHPGSGVRLAGNVRGEGGVAADWLEIAPGRVEPSVERIVVAASCDGGTFGEVADLYVRVLSAATGEQLALYAVEDATTETAILLGEFYRRNGEWKFRAVGQGYASGLPGLAADFGFTVPDDAPAPPPEADADTRPAPAPQAAPAPLSAPAPQAVPDPASQPVPVPLPVPVPEAAPQPVPVPVPEAAAVASAGAPAAPGNGLPVDFGPEFPLFEQRGSGRDVVRVDVPVPAGFVVVDVVKEGDGSFEIATLDHRNHDDKSVFFSWIENVRGRALVDHHGHAPLRLHVKTRDDWTVSVRPVSTLRELDGRLEGHGPDVLAHTGEAVDLAIRHRGDKDGEGYFEIEAVRPNGKRDHVFSRWDRGRGTVPLPEGPRLLVIKASGGWWVEPRPLGQGGFWRRRR
ncbi:TerD family protein [Streptomyces sp. NPDC018031]|uniref:TerD family protein n=1 Tax=Streptomyces sp. NPDC018031 TaxID=3365033 RepID=UPI00378D99E6